VQTPFVSGAIALTRSAGFMLLPASAGLMPRVGIGFARPAVQPRLPLDLVWRRGDATAGTAEFVRIARATAAEAPWRLASLPAHRAQRGEPRTP
jgi:hypothetical protein